MMKHNIVEDPDLEMEMMKAEIAEQDPIFRFDMMAAMFADLGTPEGDRRAMYCRKMAEIMIDKTLMGELTPEGCPGRNLKLHLN